MRQIRHGEQGHISLIIVIVIVVVIAAALGLAAWRLLGNKSSTTTSTNTSPSSQAVANVYTQCMTKFNDGVFCHAADVQSRMPFDKVASVITMTTSDTSTTSNITISQDGKGNSSMTMTGTEGTSQFVTYGGHNYAQPVSGGTWIDYGADTSSQPTDTSKDLSFLGSMLTVTIKNLGQQPCGSLTCVKYQISDSAQPSETQYVWFDTANYLMCEYQANSNGQGGSPTSTMDMKMDYKAVTISAPANAQPLSSMMNSAPMAQ